MCEIEAGDACDDLPVARHIAVSLSSDSEVSASVAESDGHRVDLGFSIPYV